MVPYNKTCISDNRIGFLALMSFSANLMSHWISQSKEIVSGMQTESI